MKSFSIKINNKIKSFNKVIKVDGDKSISHRFFLIASQAIGVSEAKGVLESEDVLNTIKALKKLGIKILKKNNIYYVFGYGLNSFIKKNNLVIYCGNSGTLARLIIGLLSCYPKKIRIIGDKSLNKRPMSRIMIPLKKLGMHFFPKNKINLPITISGSEIPLNMNFDEKIGSAQVKSSVILASLNSPGITTIKEFYPSRNHTEKMLKYAGANIFIKKKNKKKIISIKGQVNYKSFKLQIPGDISSASFFIIITLLNKNSKIIIKDVNLNPTRIGIIKILKKMKANIRIINIKNICEEKVGDIIVKSSKLKSINCPKNLVPSAIDEFPILMVAAARASGTSSFLGLEELNKKESPRLNLMNKIFKKIGIKTKLIGDAIKIEGNSKLFLKKSYQIDTMYDHRIAMSTFCIAQIFGGNFYISDCHSIDTSFPHFLNLMKKIGAKYEIK